MTLCHTYTFDVKCPALQVEWTFLNHLQSWLFRLALFFLGKARFRSSSSRQHRWPHQATLSKSQNGGIFSSESTQISIQHLTSVCFTSMCCFTFQSELKVGTCQEHPRTMYETRMWKHESEGSRGKGQEIAQGAQAQNHSERKCRERILFMRSHHTCTHAIGPRQ